jgi:hypothetical protein
MKSSRFMRLGVAVLPDCCRDGSPARSNETKTGRFNRFDDDFIYGYRPLSSATARQLLDLAMIYSARAGVVAAAEV